MKHLETGDHGVASARGNSRCFFQQLNCLAAQSSDGRDHLATASRPRVSLRCLCKSANSSCTIYIMCWMRKRKKTCPQNQRKQKCQFWEVNLCSSFVQLIWKSYLETLRWLNLKASLSCRPGDFLAPGTWRCRWRSPRSCEFTSGQHDMMLAASRWKQVMGLGHALSLQSVQGPRFQHLNKHQRWSYGLVHRFTALTVFDVLVSLNKQFQAKKNVERIPEKGFNEFQIPKGNLASLALMHLLRSQCDTTTIQVLKPIQLMQLEMPFDPTNPRSNLPYDSKKCIGKTHLHSLWWQFWRHHKTVRFLRVSLLQRR